VCREEELLRIYDIEQIDNVDMDYGYNKDRKEK
jgi:hypothetical protein